MSLPELTKTKVINVFDDIQYGHRTCAWCGSREHNLYDVFSDSDDCLDQFKNAILSLFDRSKP